MPTTPNHSPTNQVEYSDSEKGLLNIAKLNEWRTRQYGILTQLRTNSGFASGDAYVSEFNVSIDDTLKDFLQDNSVDESSTYYDELTQLYRDASIDNVTEDEWGNSPASRGVDPNDYETVEDKFAQRVADLHDTDSTQPDVADDYEDYARALTEKELIRTREIWAGISAKRQGRMFDMNGKHGSSHDEYQQSVRTLGIATLSSEIADDDDETTKNAKVITYLFDEQKRLRELTTEKLQDTKLGRYVEWMNSGSKLRKLGKAAMIGAAAAGVGAVGFLLAPVIGVGAGVAGGAAAAAAGTARFARVFGRADRNRGMTTAEEAYGANGSDIYDTEADANTSLNDRLGEHADTFDKGFETDTRAEQRKRRRAVAIGVIATAAGTGVGYALTHIDKLGDVREFAGDTFNDMRGWFSDSGLNTNQSIDGTDHPEYDRDGDGIRNGHDLSPDGGADVPELDKDGDGVRNWEDLNPDDADVTDTTQPELVGDTNGNADVLTVEEGHGYTHELMDLAEANGQNLTPMQANNLHLALVEKFGPDYVDINNTSGDTYTTSNGDIRLSEAGSAHWERGVPEFTVKWMGDRGLWSSDAS